MTIYIGSDHAGYNLKQQLIAFIQALDVKVQDLGTNSSDSVDYPDYAQKIVQAVLAGPGTGDLGIAICGTGIGVSIAANRFKGIRCALCHDLQTAEMARQHNDANILALGARLLSQKEAEDIIRVFLETPFEGGRHQQRLIKIDKFGQ